MIYSYFGRIRQIIIILALQVLVFDYIHLWGYATPLLGVMVVVYSPLSDNRVTNLVMSFLAGIVMDMFTNSPGVAAASMTLASFVQHPLLEMMVPKDSDENMLPSWHTMGMSSYSAYLAIMLAVYHVAYFVLEVFSFINPVDMIISIVSSYVLSFILAMSFELFRFAKKGNA
ncbi:MAG: rod shape-determining protein MreD [Bacteroidaceae bacterium]|nr:rod shape-determining protein MreD [Bacteroidaceae bacterium]MBR6846149.1 rod shape-determining protein MreD [Bacteroidaceae bacterium]MCR5334298.1 rod shape-determining protein MreD [Bacteroidaceae bacterium]